MTSFATPKMLPYCTSDNQWDCRVKGVIPKLERDRVRRDLLGCCHRDALAMVRLVETLGRPCPSCSPICSMMRPTGANKRDGYLLSSYRIATAPEPNSSRPTSLKSTGFDSPANNVGPWPASLGCTMNSYSSINPSSANASGSFTPPTSSPLPGSPLSC